MSTTPIVVDTKTSFLHKIGQDFKAVFSWLGSSKGQATIAAGESIVEAVDPALQGVITLANNWLAEIIKTETLAAAAGSQDGTGTQKSAAVIAALTPQVEALATQLKWPAPTAAKIASASDALVTFLNSLSA